MHQEILSKEQLELLPLVKKFSKRFYLAGGTAIALHIGHRRSIDFDLFSEKPFVVSRLSKEVNQSFAAKLLHKSDDQIHFFVHGVKITFFQYPFKIAASEKFKDIIRLPSLKTLAAMKAFAFGGRGKWKDYVDMYFLLKHHFSFEEICRSAERIFGGSFNRKLFKIQLPYFDDIDYSEEVEFMKGYAVSKDEVKNYLTEIATKKFN